VLLGGLQAEHLLVERLRLLEVVDREPAERLALAEHRVLLSFGVRG
jgi:hypothetical protein